MNAELYNKAVEELKKMYAQYMKCRNEFENMDDEYRGGMFESTLKDSMRHLETELNAQMRIIIRVFEVDPIQLRNEVMEQYA